jgi:hypothetical protein
MADHGLPAATTLDPETADFYRHALRTLSGARVPILVGGAYAFARYTGIERHTKDFDIFVRRRDAPRVLRALAGAGCRTAVPFPHWLAKAYCADDYVDVIFSSGNGVAQVDDAWFAHAVPDEVLGLPVRLVAPEEMIWSKGFIMERERFDGGDVQHILHARAERLDWSRLMERFGPHWRVLLSHLVLFGFVYPAERTRIPAEVMRELTARLLGEIDRAATNDRVSQGTLLSRGQYLVDVDQWGYRDARELPAGNMSADEIAIWTAAIEKESE